MSETREGERVHCGVTRILRLGRGGAGVCAYGDQTDAGVPAKTDLMYSSSH